MTEEKDIASATHPMYDALEAKRDVFRAVMGGTDSMRAAGKKLLPKYPAEDPKDYEIRLQSSTIDGLVQGGVESLCGNVFDGEINTTDVADKLKPWLENIDNQGNSFNIFARNVFRESFTGIVAVMADRSKVKAGDKGEEEAMGLRSYLRLYKSADILWPRFAVDPVSKKMYLAMITLRECSTERVGRFLEKEVVRYRVLMFENGVCSFELWQEIERDKKKELEMVDNGIIERVTGIPLGLKGDFLDDPQLLVESRLEIKAYQKESSFDTIEYLQMPTFVTKGYEGEETLKLGASAHLRLPAGADNDAFYMQMDAAGHATLKDSIEQIKSRISTRVNYLVEQAMAQKSAAKTATQVVTEDKNNQARLVVWSDELKDCLETALMYMGQLEKLGNDGAGSIQLSTSWSKAKVEMTAQDLTAESGLVEAGLESLETFVTKRHAAGHLPEDVTVEIEMDRIEKEMKANAGVKPVVDAKGMAIDETATTKTQPPVA